MTEDADLEAISQPEVAAARLAEQLGPDVEIEFVWIGPYTYRDHLLDEMRHGRVFFIGDAAHVVCPFGARGGNTGIQDANNLGWKLTWVQRGWADETLLDSYQTERHPAAAENLKVTRRTTRFLAPRSPFEHLMRQAVVHLAREHAFARTLVNAGRMSVANDYVAHTGLPQGGVTVQNLALRWADGADGAVGADSTRGTGDTTLMALLRDADSRSLRLCFGGPASGRQPSDERCEWCLTVGPSAAPGVDLIDTGSALATHLGVTGAAEVLVRPDAYRARSN